MDSAGNVYIADSQNFRIRKVTNGVITTVAGGGSLSANGPATSTRLTFPVGVAVDSSGNLYIADSNGGIVTEVVGGVMKIVAGTGAPLFSGDNGPATSAEVYPSAIAVDSAGSLYISDGSGRVREIVNGIIRTIAGNGGAGFGGDNGPATGAEVTPAGVVVDSSGNIYVADSANARIRLLSPSSTPACTYSVSPLTLQVPTVGGNFSINLLTDAACSWTVSNLPPWITLQSAPSGVGSTTVSISVAPNSYAFDQRANVNVAGMFVAVDQALDTANVVPSITTPGVTNAASFQEGIVPGGIITLFGSNLGASGGQTLTAPGSPWPSQLGTTSVTMNGSTAPVYYVLNQNGSEQLSVQAPWSLAGANAATVVVTTAAGSSPPVVVPVRPAQPGIFLLDAASSGATHLNGAVAGASNPASPGEAIVLYLTGLGAVSNQPATGASASLTTLSSTALTPTVTIGGTTAAVGFCGLAPGFIGLYQINVTVPPSATTGLLNLTVQAGGVTSNTASLAVKSSG